MENSKQDESLNRALNAWQLTQPLPHRFRENVWQRITALERAPARSLRQTFDAWLMSILFRPAFATAYLAVILLTGVAGRLCLGLLMFCALYAPSTAAHRQMLSSSQPELAWFQREFNLSPQEFQKIS